jgi:hypothetical protein
MPSANHLCLLWSLFFAALSNQLLSVRSRRSVRAVLLALPAYVREGHEDEVQGGYASVRGGASGWCC